MSQVSSNDGHYFQAFFKTLKTFYYYTRNRWSLQNDWKKIESHINPGFHKGANIYKDAISPTVRKK